MRKEPLLKTIQSVLGRKLFWSLITIWIISATFLGLLLIKHKTTSTKKPLKKVRQELPYERPELLGIENKIQKIDYIIYHCLLDSGLYSENIKYKVERRKSRKGTSWEYCEMEVPIKKHNIDKFYSLLKERLNRKFPTISITSSINSSNLRVIKIAIDRLTTHRLILKEKFTPSTVEVAIPRPQIAIVIDDFGSVYKQAKDFLKIKVPITFSILPFRRHSREIAKLVHEKGFEVMLHLPMEPYGYPSIKPGEGALLLSMTDDQIRRVTNRCLDDLDCCISGVNNHMGSAFTENKSKMRIVLQEIKKRHLFFLDSLTSPHSTAYKTATSLHIPAGRRDIFLDVKQTREFVSGQLKKLISIARRKGKAIAIGHPYTVTLEVLKDRLPEINKTQARIVPVSELIK